MKEMKKSLLERMKPIWKNGENNKAWKRKAAGAGCLAAATVSLSLIGSVTGRAEMVNINGLNQQYQQVSENVYLVESAAQVLELRDVSETVTVGKTFKLKQDISVSLAAQGPANGSFAGTFDGEGYVLTFTDVNLTSNAAAGTKDVSEGVLFGSLKNGAVVEDLLIQLPADASYTRTSDKGSTAGEPSVESPDFEEPVISESELVNETEDAELYQMIAGLSEVYSHTTTGALISAEDPQ